MLRYCRSEEIPSKPNFTEGLGLELVELLRVELVDVGDGVLELRELEGARDRAEERDAEHDEALGASDVFPAVARGDEPGLEEGVHLLARTVDDGAGPRYETSEGGLMALPTRKRKPREAREGAAVAWKGVVGPSYFCE
jgi:hypothetical protein